MFNFCYEPIKKPDYHPYKTYTTKNFLKMTPNKYLVKDIPTILYKNNERWNYNTGIIKNIEKAISAFESKVDKFNIKINSGGYISKMDAAVCTRQGEKEMQIKIFSVDQNSDLFKITERYNQCLTLLIENFCTPVISKGFKDKIKKLDKDSEIKEKKSDITVMNNIIYNFWLEIDSRSAYLSKFCLYEEEELEISEWFKIVKTIWYKTVDKAFSCRSSQNIIKGLLLKEAGWNILKSKIKKNIAEGVTK
jgi:hypothetical protein